MRTADVKSAMIHMEQLEQLIDAEDWIETEAKAIELLIFLDHLEASYLNPTHEEIYAITQARHTGCYAADLAAKHLILRILNE